MSGGFFEILMILLLSSVKFILAPGYALFVAGETVSRTIVITTIGGTCGVFIFYYFGSAIFRLFERRKKSGAGKRKKVFTRRNRMLVRFRKKYGLPGLALITPTILSIPIGTIIASKYFHNPYRTIPVLILSVFIWSVLITSLVHYLPDYFRSLIPERN